MVLFFVVAKAGRWLPEIVPFDHPDAEERLTLLDAPFGNRLTWGLGKRTDTVDGYLRAMLATERFHAQGYWQTGSYPANDALFLSKRTQPPQKVLERKCIKGTKQDFPSLLQM